MGNNKSMCDSVGLKRELTILVVGLDNSGKTCTSRALVGETFTDVTPTIGFSKFVTKYKGIPINIYDLGGSSRIREIWHNYFAECYGVVYVIDASDPSRMAEAKHSLSSLMRNPVLKGKPLLLLANKQDHLDALDEIDVAEKLDLEALANQCQTPTRIEICSATQGTGKNIDPIIRIGFHWLIDTILQHHEKINLRVTRDVAVQKEKEEREKEARKQRLEKLRALQNTVDNANGSAVETLHESNEHINNRNSPHPLDDIEEEWNLPGAVSENELTKKSDTPTASDIVVSELENQQEEQEAREPEVVVEKQPEPAPAANNKKSALKAASPPPTKGNQKAGPANAKGKKGK